MILSVKKINDPLLKRFIRYQNHLSIAAIKKCLNSKSHFSFKNVQKEEILKELNKLNINKVTQNFHIPTQIIKENFDIFLDFIFSNLYCCINTSSYPSLLKMVDITSVCKRRTQKVRKIITDQ